MIEPSRRALLTGLISLVAAPAIVRAGSLMPVKQMVMLSPVLEWEPVRFVLWNPVERHFDWRWAIVEAADGELEIADLG